MYYIQWTRCTSFLSEKEYVRYSPFTEQKKASLKIACQLCLNISISGCSFFPPLSFIPSLEKRTFVLRLLKCFDGKNYVRSIACLLTDIIEDIGIWGIKTEEESDNFVSYNQRLSTQI